ncbi:hypothetical protein J4Q44_G00333370 [Coregonus suidteri]|uniref:Uncharacterized protein n=1 Tax=Coregonus suidteri TaxID=861788 RepID=A0AAN8Q8R7_9TELE
MKAQPQDQDSKGPSVPPAQSSSHRQLTERLKSLTYTHNVLQACLGELFQARLGRSSMGREGAAPQSSMPWDSHSTSSNPTSLLERLQRPSRGLLSQEEVEGHLQKHREWSVFLHVERLLREMSSGLRTMDVRHNDVGVMMYPMT